MDLSKTFFTTENIGYGDLLIGFSPALLSWFHRTIISIDTSQKSKDVVLANHVSELDQVIEDVKCHGIWVYYCFLFFINHFTSTIFTEQKTIQYTLIAISIFAAFIEWLGFNIYNLHEFYPLKEFELSHKSDHEKETLTLPSSSWDPLTTSFWEYLYILPIFFFPVVLNADGKSGLFGTLGLEEGTYKIIASYSMIASYAIVFTHLLFKTFDVIRLFVSLLEASKKAIHSTPTTVIGQEQRDVPPPSTAKVVLENGIALVSNLESFLCHYIYLWIIVMFSAAFDYGVVSSFFHEQRLYANVSLKVVIVSLLFSVQYFAAPAQDTHHQ